MNWSEIEICNYEIILSVSHIIGTQTSADLVDTFFQRSKFCDALVILQIAQKVERESNSIFGISLLSKTNTINIYLGYFIPKPWCDSHFGRVKYVRVVRLQIRKDCRLQSLRLITRTLFANRSIQSDRENCRKIAILPVRVFVT